MEVGEAYHRLLKDVYHQSNHIDATPQILKTHARDHAFAMRDLNLALSNLGDSADLDSVPPLTTNGSLSVLHKSFVWLQGRQVYERVSNLQSLGVEYSFSDYENLICHYFKENYSTLFNYNLHDPNADVHTLFTSPIESFSSLQTQLPSFQNDYIDHIVRLTGLQLFQYKKMHANWVWVIPAANKIHNIRETPGGLNGHIPIRLNSIFKIQLNRRDMVY